MILDDLALLCRAYGRYGAELGTAGRCLFAATSTGFKSSCSRGTQGRHGDGTRCRVVGAQPSANLLEGLLLLVTPTLTEALVLVSSPGILGWKHVDVHRERHQASAINSLITPNHKLRQEDVLVRATPSALRPWLLGLLPHVTAGDAGIRMAAHKKCTSPLQKVPRVGHFGVKKDSGRGTFCEDTTHYAEQM